MERNCMAKSDPSNTFGDFSKKIKLDPSRQNLKPVDPNWSFEKHLSYALQEGYALLEEDAKKAPKASVTTPATPSPVLEDALAKMSDNPYVKARVQLLNKMTPKARDIIEKMERNEMERDTRWDTFSKAITILGDKLSSGN
jgi:hypothetical protein